MVEYDIPYLLEEPQLGSTAFARRRRRRCISLTNFDEDYENRLAMRNTRWRRVIDVWDSAAEDGEIVQTDDD